MWHINIYAVEYYTALKRNIIVLFAETWVDLETAVQSEVKSQREKQISHISTYMWNLEKWCRGTYFKSRNGDIHRETIGKWGWDKLGGWDSHIYTTMYKTDN